MKKNMIFYFRLILVLTSLFIFPFSAFANQNDYLIIRCYNAGMFSFFSEVIAFVKAYEQKRIAGGVVDFAQVGLYYDPKMGNNWWTYYCEPIELGSREGKNVVETYRNYYLTYPEMTEFHTSREEANYLIKKYIHFKPFILNEVNDFIKKKFGDSFVIGLHYRGTDKGIEADKVPYETVETALENEIKKLPNDNYKIFVATDEEALLQYICKKYGDKVCFFEQAFRSKNGEAIHFKNDDRFLHGKYAILDSILLSKTNTLIRTSSNLSLFSTYLNLNLTVIPLSERNQKYSNSLLPHVMKLDIPASAIQ